MFILTQTRAWKIFACLLAAYLFVLPMSIAAQQSARVVHWNLSELVTRSHLIVRARVLSATPERHPTLTNLDSVVVTVQVLERLKGEAGQTYSFRLFVWDATYAGTNLGYRKGQELVLLLHQPSEYGFSSPVGQDQGRFRVLADRAGNPVVANGWNNMGLFQGMEERVKQIEGDLSLPVRRVVREHRVGPISYDQFRELVLRLNSNGQ